MAPRDRSGSNDPRPLDTEPQRVQRLIAAAGFCSRREAETLIEQGRVMVNEEVVAIGATARIVDRISVNGIYLDFPKMVYYMLNKPAGVVTAMRDKNSQTVIELVPTEERIYPVGRLDKDTVGLILLTNDGAFATRVAHPRYEIEKTYVATLDRIFERKDAAKLAHGIPFREGLARGVVRVLSPRRIEITLHQGYNHIVKRMFGAIGYRVSELSRTRIGPLSLNIPEGAYRKLTPDEVAKILAGSQKSAVRRPYVSRDQVEAAKRQSREIRESRKPKPTTWEPRRPGKGGFFPDRPKEPRISRDERAAQRDARAEAAPVRTPRDEQRHGGRPPRAAWNDAPRRDNFSRDAPRERRAPAYGRDAPRADTRAAPARSPQRPAPQYNQKPVSSPAKQPRGVRPGSYRDTMLKNRQNSAPAPRYSSSSSDTTGRASTSNKPSFSKKKRS